MPNDDKERDPQSQQTPGGQPAGQQGGQQQGGQPVSGGGGQAAQPSKSPEELGDKKDDTSGLKKEEEVDREPNT